ncbi:nucleotide sugar dehydrogenase [Cohnella kolymensis]|uniref:nucleotide sugar dehydrogenase n=1 Tax=Cohnella kolymensis TaxID=1590652 RepID=UPI000AE61898|nr:nucleotide sugar dehydrogenase [Cohnella kolymensis]
MLKKIGVIGLGYAGLPLCRLFLRKGHKVFGIDSDANTIAMLESRRSCLSEFSAKDIRDMFAGRRFSVDSSYDMIAQSDAVIICVPAPRDGNGNPNIRCVYAAVKQCLPFLKPGQLVSVESFTFPGTMEEVLLPLIESTGLKVGKDINLVYSPSRYEAGDHHIGLSRIPKVIGGVTPGCSESAKQLYEAVFDRVVVVSSPKAAEMTITLENAYRMINISFMNELLMMSDKMKLNLWEVLSITGRKPEFAPGPLICEQSVPVDSLDLSWKAAEFGGSLKFVELARSINERMIEYVVNKVLRHLPTYKQLKECKILAVGVSYKKDINDMRESSCLKIIEKLLNLGVNVNYHDPYVPQVEIGDRVIKRIELTKRQLKAHDCVLILTDHSTLSTIS